MLQIDVEKYSVASAFKSHMGTVKLGSSIRVALISGQIFFYALESLPERLNLTQSTFLLHYLQFV